MQVYSVQEHMNKADGFAPEGKKAEEAVTFRRSEAFDIVGDECRAVRNSVGVLEISGYAKYEITGSGAEGRLSHMLANKVPAKGRMTLALAPSNNDIL